jgi:hypothetical protein
LRAYLRVSWRFCSDVYLSISLRSFAVFCLKVRRGWFAIFMMSKVELLGTESLFLSITVC